MVIHIAAQFFSLLKRRITIKFFNKKNILTAILIAFLYVALTIFSTYALSPVNFGILQLNVADALTVLPLFSLAAIPGLTVGCAAANTYCVLFKEMIPQDVVAGSLATLIAAVLTHIIGRKCNRKICYVVGPLPPVIVNTIIIGAELTIFYTKTTLKNLILNTFYVLITKFIICYTLGLFLIYIIYKNNIYNKFLNKI